MFNVARRRPSSRRPTILATVMVSALLVFTFSALCIPGTATASVGKAAACSASLRTRPSTSALRKVLIKTGTRVTVATTVTGGSWRATCAGRTPSGKSWYRISAVNGRSVKSLYGVTYVYAATGLFKPIPTPITKYAACSASLRTRPAANATSKVTIRTDTKVTVATKVAGSGWRKMCAGRAVSGKNWYRISAINGRSVRTLYGVTYLYGPSGLFKATTATPTTATPPIPTSAPPVPNPSLKVVGLTPAMTASQFVAAVGDNSTDVIELAGGTYRPGRISLNVNRTRPVVIRPKAGATVVFTGPNGGSSAVVISGGAANITLTGIIFDGYTMADTGIVWVGNAHNITLNNITVRNSTGQGGYSWGLYLSYSGGVAASNITARNWTVDGGNRTVGGLQIGNSTGPDQANVTVTGWTVNNAAYAIYSATGASSVSIDGWTISNSGLGGLSVDLVACQGAISNVHATNSGGAMIVPPMVNAGGNTWR